MSAELPDLPSYYELHSDYCQRYVGKFVHENSKRVKFVGLLTDLQDQLASTEPILGFKNDDDPNATGEDYLPLIQSLADSGQPIKVYIASIYEYDGKTFAPITLSYKDQESNMQIIFTFVGELNPKN